MPYCPEINGKVVYLTCMECEKRKNCSHEPKPNNPNNKTKEEPK